MWEGKQGGGGGGGDGRKVPAERNWGGGGGGGGEGGGGGGGGVRDRVQVLVRMYCNRQDAVVPAKPRCHASPGPRTGKERKVAAADMERKAAAREKKATAKKAQ